MQKITCRIPATTSLRLDQAIIECPEVIKAELSRTLVRKLIVAGAVYVNGKRVRIASRKTHGGEIIDLYWDKARTPERFTAERFLPLRVLYEDEAIIAFDKPPGLPTQPTLDEARINLFALAQSQLERQTHKSVYIGMHHRLDRDTSGVIVFTREKQYNSFIAAEFKEHKCFKIYAAVVHGRLKNHTGTLESYLAPVSKRGKQSKFGSVKSGGKKAITNYLVLAENANYSLIEVKIETGRTHQIRVHFSEMGHPIVGDTLYGSDQSHYNTLKRHLLHAHVLSIHHPVTSNMIRIESPIPPEFRQWTNAKK